jgi:tRNA (guanine26-N2/guanine27-N2)-dimethyltransferase
MPPRTPTLVKEGTTEVFVTHATPSAKGPSTRTKGAFYNPAMELNRDISILVNQWFITRSSKHVRLLDGLAASGIRGVRYAHELTGDFDVTLNEWDEKSFSLLQQNVQHSSVSNITLLQKDLHVVLSEDRYDSIDIDPFGSPVYFLNAAMRNVTHQGMISCTATDTAALCGVFPKVCFRRYSAWPLHGPTMHEVGLRILLGVVCREAAQYDRGIEPLLCYATDHYLRLYVQINKSKNAANASIAQCSSIPAAAVPLSKEQSTLVGPLWRGKLQNKTVVQEIQALVSTKTLGTRPALWNLLVLLEEEADAPPFFYTTNDLASLLKQSPPPMDRLFERLRQRGFLVTRTHCTPTGFKTNAPLEVITEVFK